MRIHVGIFLYSSLLTYCYFSSSLNTWEIVEIKPQKAEKDFVNSSSLIGGSAHGETWCTVRSVDSFEFCDMEVCSVTLRKQKVLWPVLLSKSSDLHFWVSTAWGLRDHELFSLMSFIAALIKDCKALISHFDTFLVVLGLFCRPHAYL